MIKGVLRAIYYFSILALFILLVWAYSTAKTWQEVAVAGDKAQAKAALVTKETMERANRCFSELYKANPPAKGAAKTPTTASTR